MGVGLTGVVTGSDGCGGELDIEYVCIYSCTSSNFIAHNTLSNFIAVHGTLGWSRLFNVVLMTRDETAAIEFNFERVGSTTLDAASSKSTTARNMKKIDGLIKDIDPSFLGTLNKGDYRPFLCLVRHKSSPTKKGERFCTEFLGTPPLYDTIRWSCYSKNYILLAREIKDAVTNLCVRSISDTGLRET